MKAAARPGPVDATRAQILAALLALLGVAGCDGSEVAVASVAAGGDGGSTSSSVDGSIDGADGSGATGGADGGPDGAASDATVDAPPFDCGNSAVHWIWGPRSPTFMARWPAISAWTGRYVLIWGGKSAVPDIDDKFQDGARFDPQTDAWSMMAPKPAELTTPSLPSYGSRFRGTWAKTELFVWARGPAVGFYSPDTDTWRMVNAEGAPLASFEGGAVTTIGDGIFFWGGYSPVDAGPALAEGGRFDLTTQTWQSIPTTGNPQPRIGPAGVAANDRLIVWGGLSQAFPSSLTAWLHVDGGDIYDPTAGTWTQIPSAPGDVGQREPAAVVWTGAELIVWGGEAASGELRGDGAAYNPSTDAWRVISQGPSVRQDVVVLWTGREMLVCGGWTPVGDTGWLPEYVTQVWLYDPVLDRWRIEAVCDAPSWASGVPYWTGTDALFVDRGVWVNRLIGL